MLLYQFMHSSESISGVQKNFHSIHPSGVYTFFQQNPCALNGKFISFQKHVGFLANQFYFYFTFFCFFSWGILQYTCISNIYCEVFFLLPKLHTCLSKVFSLPKHTYIYFVRYDYLPSLCLFYLNS